MPDIKPGVLLLNPGRGGSGHPANHNHSGDFSRPRSIFSLS